ncbi:hypothetical protein EGW08_017511, partial [Elysia chlorotica]
EEDNKKNDARQQSKKNFIPLPRTDPEKKPNIWASDEMRTSVYPEMVNVNDRLKSFNHYLQKHHHHHRVLADLGFFYSGGDCIRCFHCGLELRNWLPDDDVAKEHYQYSPSCDYPLRSKGWEY